MIGRHIYNQIPNLQYFIHFIAHLKILAKENISYFTGLRYTYWVVKRGILLKNEKNFCRPVIILRNEAGNTVTIIG
jgi:hypothetical protein